MRVCLVRCPSPFLIDDKVFPPLGLMAVGTIMKENGNEVYLHDGSMDNVPMDYECYGFGPTTPEYPYALEMKDRIKKNTKAKVIIGGPHATVATKQCISDGFDYVTAGSFEDYPMIDRTLVNIKDYKYFINGELATTVVTSLGCPYKCAFCCKVYSGFKMRDRKDVTEEIEYLHHDFGYNGIMFFDDIFIMDKLRTAEICSCLKKLGISWRCFARADLIVKHGEYFTKMMGDSGCWEVGMGIESGSDTVLKNIGKGENIATIKTAVKMLKKEKIRVKGFFILGLPGESRETIQETNDFLEEMQLDDVDIRIYQPYPGTQIWDNRERYDLKWERLPLDKSFYKGRPGEYYGNVSTSSMTNQEIHDLWIELENRYKWSSA